MKRSVDATDIQREARALGDPTRHQIFRYIVDSERPVGVAELTEYVQLHHNAVRQHLAVLKEAELIVEEFEPRDRPGRPRVLFRLHPEAAGKWETTGAYEWLAGLLSEAMANDLTSREVGREEGKKRGEEYVATDDPVDTFERDLIRSGFRPTRSERGRQVDFVLERCPFAEVAASNPGTVCELHLGLAEGLTESLGGLKVDRLTAKNPHRAGCRLVVKRDPMPA